MALMSPTNITVWNATMTRKLLLLLAPLLGCSEVDAWADLKAKAAVCRDDLAALEECYISSDPTDPYPGFSQCVASCLEGWECKSQLAQDFVACAASGCASYGNALGETWEEGDEYNLLCWAEMFQHGHMDTYDCRIRLQICTDPEGWVDGVPP